MKKSVPSLRPPHATTSFITGLAMHHIYCDRKKAFMEDEARRLGLSGIFLYGKPGRVVVEGASAETVARFASQVTGLRWQKVKVMVEARVQPNSDQEDGRASRCASHRVSSHLDCVIVNDGGCKPLFTGLEIVYQHEHFKLRLRQLALEQLLERVERPFGASVAYPLFKE